MNRINIVYLVFGNSQAYHTQAYFSILTALKGKREGDKVTVYTDAPRHYARLASHIEVRELGKATLEQWINGTGYVFRAKIKAIEDCAASDPGAHLLFLDGDTCLQGGIDSIAQLLDSGTGLMHKDEGHPSAMKGPSLRMWNAMKGKSVGGCTVSMRHNVWNSGVIAIPAGRAAAVCAMALQACDAILDSGVGCFTAEQYAFSIAMQEAMQLQPAERWVAHYWGNKEEWEARIADFIMQAHTDGLALHDEIKALEAFPMATLPLFVRKSNTQRRLVKLIKRMFNDKVQER